MNKNEILYDVKKLPLFFLILMTGYLCYSQSIETAIYIREELVKQKKELLKQVQEIQIRIDSIDQKVRRKNNSKQEVKYFSKTVKYDPNNYSNSLDNKPTQKKKRYNSKTTRAYYRGSRGGCYYINSNGNKTYVSRNICN